MTVLRDLLNQPHPAAMARAPSAATGQIVAGPGVAPRMAEIPKIVEIPNTSVGALQGDPATPSALPNLLLLVGVGAAAYFFGKRQGKAAVEEKASSKVGAPIPGIPTVKVGARVAPALPEGSLKVKKAASPPLLRTTAPVSVEYDLGEYDDFGDYEY
jgi:hypothetical protein